MTRDLKKVGLVDQNALERPEDAGRGRRQQFESMKVALDMD